jgi:hypothetical protein
MGFIKYFSVCDDRYCHFVVDHDIDEEDDNCDDDDDI